MKVHLFGDLFGNDSCEYSLTDESSCSSYGLPVLRREREGFPPEDFGRWDWIETEKGKGHACDVVGNMLDVLQPWFADRDFCFVEKFVNGGGNENTLSNCCH